MLQCKHVNKHSLSLTHTHHFTHTIPKYNKTKNPETANKQGLQSMIFTIRT